MAFDTRKMALMLHRRQFEVEGPPLPPEMEKARVSAKYGNLGAASLMAIAAGVVIGASFGPLPSRLPFPDFKLK